ncbi:MAG: hypothetical protein ABIN25_03720, partial [Ginsengibacter sp.]
YAGTASAEEISLLQLEGLINEQDTLYAEALHADRAQKMNWEFEDFMKDVSSAKVVAFQARGVWIKRLLSAAAMVAAIVTVYIFWPQTSPNKIANIPAADKLVDSSKELIATAILPADEIKDSTRRTEKTATASKQNIGYAINTHKKRPVQKSIKTAEKQDVKTNEDLQDYLVIVNGKPITNEEDAVAIARESLGMISRNLTLTADELRPISQIKIKL